VPEYLLPVVMNEICRVSYTSDAYFLVVLKLVSQLELMKANAAAVPGCETTISKRLELVR
jgi:hypothetical protein